MTDNAANAALKPPASSAPQLDWGRGHYERTAAALLPAAEAVVGAAALIAGDTVLDVGCGTGNVALIAARAGACVTAVDPASRLLDVTRSQAQREGLELEILVGEAASLPLPDATFDAVLSNFAVIFAPDPAAAIAELGRVLRPSGRIVFSAWLPGATIGRMNGTAMDLVRKAVGAPTPPPAFRWHDEQVLEAAFAAHGMTVTLTQHDVVFTDNSPAAYLDAERASHPMAIAGFDVLERTGQAAAAHEILLRILEEGNEDPNAFRISSNYVIVTARKA